MSVYNIEDFGALKNSGMLATEAIAHAIEAASEAGGGTVYVPAGTFYTGAIVMKSNIELNLNPGAILSFSTNSVNYPAVECRWEGVKQQVHTPCIHGKGLVNISITGNGTINGNGKAWWDVFRNRPEELKYPVRL